MCLDILLFSMVDMYLCIVFGHPFIFICCVVLSFYDMSTFGMDMSIVDEYCYLSFVLCIYA